MRYSDSYIANHDIDWFCTIGGLCVHVASAGGKIPELINDDDQLRTIQHQVELLPDIYSDEDIFYNEAAISKAIGQDNGPNARDQYIESFSAMARKGFISLDKKNIADPEDNHYQFVCWPSYLDRMPLGLDLPEYTLGGDDNSLVIDDDNNSYVVVSISRGNNRNSEL